MSERQSGTSELRTQVQELLHSYGSLMGLYTNWSLTDFTKEPTPPIPEVIDPAIRAKLLIKPDHAYSPDVKDVFEGPNMPKPISIGVTYKALRADKLPKFLSDAGIDYENSDGSLTPGGVKITLKEKTLSTENLTALKHRLNEEIEKEIASSEHKHITTQIARRKEEIMKNKAIS